MNTFPCGTKSTVFLSVGKILVNPTNAHRTPQKMDSSLVYFPEQKRILPCHLDLFTTSLLIPLSNIAGGSCPQRQAFISFHYDMRVSLHEIMLCYRTV